MSNTISVLGIIWTDTVNYSKISTTIMFTHCDFKCDKLCGKQVCQNSSLAKQKPMKVPIDSIIYSYINDPISKALVCQGLEPFDDFEDLKNLISAFIEKSEDDIVIYTGYEEHEVYNYIQLLKVILNNYEAKNRLIIKFGRFIPDYEPHYDPVLGVKLASYNQYAIILH